MLTEVDLLSTDQAILEQVRSNTRWTRGSLTNQKCADDVTRLTTTAAWKLYFLYTDIFNVLDIKVVHLCTVITLLYLIQQSIKLISYKLFILVLYANVKNLEFVVSANSLLYNGYSFYMRSTSETIRS